MLAVNMILQLLAVPVLIALNAFFVASEYAIVTIRGSKIEELRQQGVRAATVLARLKRDVGDVLAAIQICITGTNLLIGAVAEPAVTSILVKLLSPLGFFLPPPVARTLSLIIGLTIVTFFTVVLSELLPKALTLQFTERVALRVARPAELVRRFCMPLVRMMNWTANWVTMAVGLGRMRIKEPVPSEAELEILVDQAGDAGEFHHELGLLLRRAFDFADLRVRHVMIPMDRAGVIRSNASVDELATRLSDRPFTRWVLRDPATGRVNGIVNVKMALYAQVLAASDAVILHDLATPPVRLPPEMPLVDALHSLRLRRAHIAVVAKNENDDLGIVTLEDILESLVGHIPSETRMKSEGSGGG